MRPDSGEQSASGKWEEAICMLGIAEFLEEAWLSRTLEEGEDLNE